MSKTDFCTRKSYVALTYIAKNILIKLLTFYLCGPYTRCDFSQLESVGLVLRSVTPSCQLRSSFADAVHTGPLLSVPPESLRYYSTVWAARIIRRLSVRVQLLRIAGLLELTPQHCIQFRLLSSEKVSPAVLILFVNIVLLESASQKPFCVHPSEVCKVVLGFQLTPLPFTPVKFV